MRGGALLKSVSLFLGAGARGGRGRRASAAGAASGRQSDSRRARGGAMADAAAAAAAAAAPAASAAPAATTKAQGAKVVDALKRQTHFTRQEIEALTKVYRKLVESHCLQGAAPSTTTAAISSMQSNTVKGEGLDRMVFRELLHNTFDVVTEEVLMDRIFCAFDRCNAGVIRMEEWVCGLSGFLRGTHEERTAFAFFVYDLNSDGFISREEMFHLLRNSLVKSPQDEDPDEGVRDLVELALRKMDGDKDGRISFEDFHAAVADEPLLLEAFGQCLPADAACQTFLSTLQC